MMRLIVSTQYLENYGFVDGGDHWKFKGGSEYEVAQLSYNECADLGEKGIAELAFRLAEKHVEYRNPASEEYMVDYYLVPVGKNTDYEQEQLEISGEVFSPVIKVA